MRIKFRMGFTLIELMIAVGVLVIAFLGLLGVFTACLELNETSKNLTIALHGAQRKMEEIRDHNFGQIYSNYTGSGANFELAGLPDADSEGSIVVDNSDPELLQVTVTVCWKQKRGRIFGEDRNLNGSLEIEEDSDTDGRMDSPVQITTLITQR